MHKASLKNFTGLMRSLLISYKSSWMRRTPLPTGSPWGDFTVVNFSSVFIILLNSFNVPLMYCPREEPSFILAKFQWQIQLQWLTLTQRTWDNTPLSLDCVPALPVCPCVFTFLLLILQFFPVFLFTDFAINPGAMTGFPIFTCLVYCFSLTA